MKNPSTRLRAPDLRFTPTAWAKLLYLLDYGDTEVGGFAITEEADPLLIIDVRLVRQRCSLAFVAFDDEAVADFYDEQVDLGRQPQNFARVWVHTHPGDCPEPSATDEDTFERVFGRSEWGVMFIVARTGATYARLRFNLSHGVEIELPVSIDYSLPFEACDRGAWEQEYVENVTPETPKVVSRRRSSRQHPDPFEDEDRESWYDAWQDYLEQDEMHVD